MLLEKLIAQVVLDQKGLSPDFSDQFSTSVSSLIERLGSEEKSGDFDDSTELETLRVENQLLLQAQTKLPNSTRVTVISNDEIEQVMKAKDETISHLRAALKESENALEMSATRTRSNLDALFKAVDHAKMDNADRTDSKSLLEKVSLEESFPVENIIPESASSNCPPPGLLRLTNSTSFTATISSLLNIPRSSAFDI